jgi:hypothetical protein
MLFERLEQGLHFVAKALISRTRVIKIRDALRPGEAQRCGEHLADMLTIKHALLLQFTCEPGARVGPQ